MGVLNSDLKVLIVDDSRSMRKIVSRMLAEIGLTCVYEANGGKNALDTLKEEKMDVILLDWNMPGMNGLDVVRAIRADRDLQTIPIIMLTAEALKENIVAAVMAGANEYTTKPFTEEVLEGKIKRVLGI